MPKASTCTDNRRFNNPHQAIYEAGRQAQLAGFQSTHVPTLTPASGYLVARLLHRPADGIAPLTRHIALVQFSP